MIKQLLKRILLKRKGIVIDSKSLINLSVTCGKDFRSAIIVDTYMELKEIGNGCFLEHVYGYGNIYLDRYVSISGPGTVLHSVNGKIKIGAFTSIGQNVSINEFNHRLDRVTSYAMQFFFFSKNFKDDVISKGDVIIDEDVWIGSNSVICSGVHIGRGCVIAGGSVITKDTEPYTIVGGVNCVLKKRFSRETIMKLEESKWWEWSDEKITQNRDFFEQELQ